MSQGLPSSHSSYSVHHRHMDPAATSSKQPPMAVLPVQSLEQTLRDLHVDIEVQSFIEQVLSHPARSTPTELSQKDARPAAGSGHSVLPVSSSMTSSRLFTLRFDTLSMAMEELGFASSAVAVMKTAQLEELMSMPEPTPEGRQVLLELAAQQSNNDPLTLRTPIIVKVESLAAALLKLGITEVTATRLLEVAKQKQAPRYNAQAPNAERRKVLLRLAPDAANTQYGPNPLYKSTFIQNPSTTADAKTLERRRRLVALTKEAFPDGRIPDPYTSVWVNKSDDGSTRYLPFICATLVITPQDMSRRQNRGSMPCGVFGIREPRCLKS
ncbi:hypothetical protein D9615_001026 [Tricholomella constricta]|uniref:Uncharacterized protein n=1 Tax=Tricholomella constricta TaxID=117010 RepID=A0A8H5M8V6_9AGAR|nr:hypothetical protein D9615_001026 [Tricholomella constricta]